MPIPLPPDHPIAQLTPEEKAALPETAPGAMTHVSLSGIGITEDGSMKKTKYLDIINATMDDYSDILLTAGEAARLATVARTMKHGASAAIPILCAGPACIFASRCPWQQIGKAPIGKACIWELSMMKQWQLNYLEEYEVDPENFTEMTLISELVEIELQIHRVNLFLAANPEHAVGVVDAVVGIDKQGNQVMQKQISQHVELREKLFSRKHRLVKYLVGDRQEQYKKEAALKTRESRDPSSSMAQIKEQMEALQRQLTRAERAAEPVVGAVVESVSQTEQKESAREGTELRPDDIQVDE